MWDYPLATRCPEHILTPTGKPLTDITLEKVLSGEVGPQDVRISRQTLEYQAQITEQMQRHAVARNFHAARPALIAILTGTFWLSITRCARSAPRRRSCWRSPTSWSTPGMRQ